ncbi:PheS-related mystery ligase SrmL [Flexivirga lutea]
MTSYLSSAELRAALDLRDLTDPDCGPHALQLMSDDIIRAVTALGAGPVRSVRQSPLVSIAGNYDALGYDRSDVTRNERYSRYVSPTVMLRSHTSAMLPPTLASHDGTSDVVYAAAGLAYRRDAIDRTHTGEPHQLDLWRVTSERPRTVEDVVEQLSTVARAVLPGCRWRVTASHHSYTLDGRQLDVWDAARGEWLELAEGGLIAPWLLDVVGLPSARWTGVAAGLGLDRALMLRKRIPDIRLLRATDPRVAAQMLDLSLYRPVSLMPPARRDLSVVSSWGIDEEVLGDRVRSALGDRAADLEAVELLAVTTYDDLPQGARVRLGLHAGQVNALVRLTLRAIGRTLTAAEANRLRDTVYLAIHEGPVRELIG